MMGGDGEGPWRGNTLIWLGAAVAALVLAATADLIYRATVDIPLRVAEEQSEAALAILERQATFIKRLPEADRVRLAQVSLAAEAADRDLRALAMIDAKDRIVAASRPDWRGLSAVGPLPGYGTFRTALAQSRGETILRIDPEGVVLRAARPLRGPGQSIAAPAALYLELDLGRAEWAAWAERLSLSGWIRPLLPAAFAVALTALLAHLLFVLPLRRLTALIGGLARARAEDDDRPPQEPPERIGYGLDGLADELGRLCRRMSDTDADLHANRGRWQYALEGGGDGLWDWDMAGDRIYYSPRWKALLGCAEDEIGDSLSEWFSRVHPDDLALCRASMEHHRAGEIPDFLCEHRMRLKDGGWSWFQDRGRVLKRAEDGRPLRMIGTLSRIDERKAVEHALAYLVTLDTVLAETSRSLLAAQPEAVEQVVDRVLGALARRMGVERANIFVLAPDGSQLRSTHEWYAADVRSERPQDPALPIDRLPRLMETLRHGEDVRIDDLAALPEAWQQDRSVLEPRGVRALAAVPLRAGERLGGFVSVQMDTRPRDWREHDLRALRLLTYMLGAAFERRKFELELLESRQRVEEVRLYDTLTGLPNRRLLAERMREAMAGALESGTQLAVCYLDLDGFKPINDTYGHEVGDRVLVAAAGRLRGQVPESDTVARLGGDEFVLLMGGFDSLIECANLLDRLIALLARPYTVDGMELRVTASAGVTLYPRDAHDADTLLRHADHAMYQAKQRGRNRCRFFDTLRDRRALVRRSQLERIGDAIEGDELLLYYQPKVDMRLGLPVGAEALVRWQHPEQGLLAPGSFIPLMEGSDLQQRLDWWVLDRAMDQLETWQARGLTLDLSVNISARSVQHEGFVEELDARLKRHLELAPGVLSLEILESEALVDLDTVARVIERCQGLGVRFALDDFGTGYSSLTYFRRLPAQVLKIDRTFVRDMLRSSDDRNIVEGVIGLAHAFQREVIAEGVESAAHGLMLLRMGCERAQGYGVAEPMPAAELPDWFRDWVSPELWSVASDLDWSEETLDLLAMESVHRNWVSRLVRASLKGGAARPPELDKEQSGFGRWLYGEGRRHFGHLSELEALLPLHESVHARARALAQAAARGLSTQDEVAGLLTTRDLLMTGLQRLQVRVLVQGR
jgi:diguanylate cyclase (GGDEF)-like protein/PAS domain S-box-containing protein